jgi:hypothetical protein
MKGRFWGGSESRRGLDASETPRGVAYGAHAIMFRRRFHYHVVDGVHRADAHPSFDFRGMSASCSFEEVTPVDCSFA